MDAFANNNADKIKKEINVNSLIDYLIIDQIMGEVDHMYKSFNMYYTNISEFNDIVIERYNHYAVKAVENYLENLDKLVDSMKVSIKLNHDKWYYEYDENLSNDNIKLLKDFLERRLVILGKLWKKK